MATTLETSKRDAAYYRELGQQMMQAEADQRRKMRGMKFDTIAVHGIYGAQAALQNQGSIIEPVFLSSAQHFESSDHMEAALAYEIPSWIYTRITNPTLHYLEETLALLEGYGYAGEVSCCVVASGMAAVFMATQPWLTGAGPMNIVATARCYGGTFMLFEERYRNERGIEIRWVRDPLNLDEWAEKIDANTRFIYGEMPSNPALAVMDTAAVANIAHQHDIPLIVDATIATPALMRPIQHGADIVVHSLSKTITSSGLAIAGAVLARHDLPFGPEVLRPNFARHLRQLPVRDFGPGLSPFNALMTLNDLRGLRNKMAHFSRNTLQVAQFLDSHPMVEQVNYPGLPDHPGHDLAQRDMRLVDSDEPHYGHLLSFDVKGGHMAARQVLDGLGLIWRATDLGRVKSLATIPAISTHQQQGEDGRDLAGVPANQIRLGVGGEHPDDLIADLDQALNGLA